MTRRRRILQGSSYRITARCFERRYYLVPSEEVDQTVGFVLAHCARKYGVLVHAWVVMSNHVHLDVTDPNRKITQFVGLFKSLVARALNAKRGRWEYFWAPPPCGLVRVATREDAIRGMSYTLVNPVAAGLVETAEAWPGRGTLPAHLAATADKCHTYHFEKPGFFFRLEKDGGKLPDRISLTLTPHPMGAADPERFLVDVLQRVDALTESAERKRAQKKSKVMGAARVRRQKYWQRPKTREPRRRLIPSFAAGSPELRIQLAIEQKLFDAEYEAALGAWLKRGRAVFPAGTCKMCSYPGVTVRGAPAAA